MRFPALYRRLSRTWDYLMRPRPAARPAARTRLSAEPLERRDVPASVDVHWAADAVEGGDPGWFRLVRDGDLSESLEVGFTVFQDPADVAPVPETVTFAAGDDTAWVPVTAYSDSEEEGPEYVIAMLGGPGYDVGLWGSAVVTVHDAPPPPPPPPPPPLPVVSVSAADTAEAAAAGGFTLTRTGDLSGPLTVTYDVGGFATPGDDYDALPGSVTFEAGASEAVVRVLAHADGMTDGGEDVVLTLTGGGSGYEADPAAGLAVVSIADEASEVGVYRLSDGEEGVSGGVFRFYRTGDTSADMTVTYQVGGTAAAGEDYEALPGSVTILAGEWYTDVAVNVYGGGGAEGTETVTVSVDENADRDVAATGSASLLIRDADTRRSYWVSTGSSDWNDPANWSGGEVPLETDHVYLTGASSHWVTNFGEGLTRLAGLTLDGYEGVAVLANAMAFGTLHLTAGTAGSVRMPAADRTLTVEDSLVWEGGNIGDTADGAEVVLDGADGRIDAGEGGSVGTGSTLRLLAGTVVTHMSGTLSFLGGEGLVVADGADVKAWCNTQNATIIDRGAGVPVGANPRVLIEGGGNFMFILKPRLAGEDPKPGAATCALPIENAGGILYVGRVDLSVSGRVGGLQGDGPSVRQTSGTFTLRGGSVVRAQHGTVVEAGKLILNRVWPDAARVYGTHDGPVVEFTGDLHVLANATVEFHGDKLVLLARGNFVWGGTLAPRMSAPDGPVLGSCDRIEVRKVLYFQGTAQLAPDYPGVLAAEPGNAWEIATGFLGVEGTPPPAPAGWPAGWHTQVVTLTESGVKALRLIR